MTLENRWRLPKPRPAADSPEEPATVSSATDQAQEPAPAEVAETTDSPAGEPAASAAEGPSDPSRPEDASSTVEPAGESEPETVGEADAPSGRTSRPRTSNAQYRSPPQHAPGSSAGHPTGGRSQYRGEDRQRREAASPAPMIADLLKEGQEILVQIAKEPLGTKGARITSHIAIPGRYLVYMPTVNHIGVSRKISSGEERQRLRKIIQDNRGDLPGGFIVRTAGEYKGEDEFKADIGFLRALWTEVKTQSDKKSAPAIIHRELNLVQRILRDQFNREFSAIRVDNELAYASIVELIHRFQPSLVKKVKLYTRETPIFEEFGVQAELDKALRSQGLAEIGRLYRHRPGRGPGGHRREHRKVRGQVEQAGRHHCQDQHGGGQGDCPSTAAARPGRHHRLRLHRHGGPQEPAQGDPDAGDGFEEGQVTVESASIQ